MSYIWRWGAKYLGAKSSRNLETLSFLGLAWILKTLNLDPTSLFLHYSSFNYSSYRYTGVEGVICCIPYIILLYRDNYVIPFFFPFYFPSSPASPLPMLATLDRVRLLTASLELQYQYQYYTLDYTILYSLILSYTIPQTSYSSYGLL